MAEGNSDGERDIQDAILSITTVPRGKESISELLWSTLSIALSSFHTTQDQSFFPILLNTMLSHLRKSIHAKNYRKNLFKMHKFFDSHPPFEIEKEILAGSWSEGLFLFHPSLERIPDMDFMCILKNISLSKEDQTNGNLILKDHTPFVDVYLTDTRLLQNWEQFSELCPQDETKLRLSSWKLKLKLHNNYKHTGQLIPEDTMHEECGGLGDGPSMKLSMDFGSNKLGKYIERLLCFKVSDPLLTCDIVISIFCEGWPENAQEWLERDRLWPNNDLIRTICDGGFHIVAKSSHEGNFRLSFSVAETTLFANLSPFQHKVARAFKAIIKYHQDSWSPNFKEIMPSYHVKTLLLWHYEKFTEASWTEDNVVSHLFLLLDELVHALRTAYLPMYFLPKYNLLCNVDDFEEIRRISDEVMKLSKDVCGIKSSIYDLGHIKFNADLPSLIGIAGDFLTDRVYLTFHESSSIPSQSSHSNHDDPNVNEDNASDKTQARDMNQCFPS